MIAATRLWSDVSLQLMVCIRLSGGTIMIDATSKEEEWIPT